LSPPDDEGDEFKTAAVGGIRDVVSRLEETMGIGTDSGGSRIGRQRASNKSGWVTFGGREHWRCARASVTALDDRCSVARPYVAKVALAPRCSSD
jgi:hypothetical protein